MTLSTRAVALRLLFPLLLASCATTTPPTDAPVAASLDVVAPWAADRIVWQLTESEGSSGSWRRWSGSEGVIAVDHFIDAKTAQETALTRKVQALVEIRLDRGQPHFDAQTLSRESLAQARYVLAGSVRSTSGDHPTQHISLTLIDRQTRAIVAHTAADAADPTADLTPTEFYRDSPTLVSDSIAEAYLRTAEARSGLADPAYGDALDDAARTAEGIEAYERHAYGAALGYLSPESGGAPRSLRALNGVYLADWKLGKTEDAARAFSLIVARGIDQRNLGVKFLFEPGSTAFIADKAVSGAYGMWLHEIAIGAERSPACLEVVGHASHTGTEQANEVLSRQRAQSILDRLAAEASGLPKKATVEGVGFRENIVGIGTDDARDALDRRVAFKFPDCGTLRR